MLLVDMECSHCGLPTTEDDLYLSLDCGELTCEGCFDEGKSKSLKEENKKLKDAAFQDVQEVDVKSLQEEINKLKKEIKEYEFESCESAVTLPKLYGEIKKLKEENDTRKSLCDHFEMLNKKNFEEKEKLKEENKKLKEAVEGARWSMPDRCVDCDCLFDLHSAMNDITCEEDEGLRKKYDEYFGSDNNRGNLCRQCIREELP